MAFTFDNPDLDAFEARLDAVHSQVLQLHRRLTALEQPRVAATSAWGRPPTPSPGDPAPGAAPQPAPGYPEPQPPSPQPPPAQHRDPAPPLAGSPVGPAPAGAGPVAQPRCDAPAHDLALESSSAGRWLAIAGGSALLLGLAFFVGYAIEQSWLTAPVRLVLAGLAALVLTASSWPLARRGHEAVAGALGGAGLGAWLATWLVARHVHELVTGPQTFLALGLGAATCLVLADRLRLRLMAGLAGLAACTTPVLVAAGGGRLSELMVYQLVVLAVFAVLDLRRRWPELPTLGLLATWGLTARWVALHGDEASAGALVPWALVLLLASAASAWRLLKFTAEQSREGERALTNLRLLGGGLATWAACAWALLGAPLAAATVLLALWHGGLALVLQRRGVGSSSAKLLTGLAWLQAMVAGPIVLTEAALAWWWIALALAAAVIPGRSRSRDVLVALPALAAVTWSIAADHDWSLLLGLLAAGVVLGQGLRGRGSSEAGASDTAELLREPGPAQAGPSSTRPATSVGLLAVAGTALWVLVVACVGPESLPLAFTGALLPVVAVVVRSLSRPDPRSLAIAGAHLGAALLGAAGLALAFGGFSLTDTAAAANLHGGLVAPLLGLAGLGVALLHRSRRTCPEAGAEGSLGLLVAGHLALVGALLVAGGVQALDGSPALGQAGYTLCLALTGLGLLVAGLRRGQLGWRQLGLVAIGAAAVKIVGFDLADAGVIWRALSFVGLGGVLIAGAFAYSRAQARLGGRAEATSRPRTISQPQKPSSASSGIA